MATIKISTQDVHLIETVDGNISATFKVLSHDQFLDSLKKSNAEMVREVLISVSGLKLVVDDVEVTQNDTLQAILDDPGLTNWFFDEYQVFWGKKARITHSKPPPDTGQAATAPVV